MNTALGYSVAGPFFFNFYAIYVLLRSTFSDASVQKTLGFIGYLIYSAVVMIVAVKQAPGVAMYWLEEAAKPDSFWTNWVPPSQDSKAAPDFDDSAYLDELIDGAGNWPSSQEKDEILQRMRENIEADQRPPTAKSSDDLMPSL